MFDFLLHLFDTEGFNPRWYCGSWSSGHGWLHILSDLGVWSAYLAIPCVLGNFVVRRRDIPFRLIFLLFGAFILACGTTHLMEAIIFYWPAYRLAGAIKLFTAIVSWATVIALVPVVPKALAMRSSDVLEREIAARREAEDRLQIANEQLERRVEERTAELVQAANALRISEERLRLALEAAHMGTWEWHISDGQMILSPALEAIHGLAPRTFSGSFASYQEVVHPEDLNRVVDSLTRAVKEEEEHHLEYRICWPDGTSHWIEAHGKIHQDEARGPRRMMGVCMKIDERKQVEEAVRFQAHLLDNVKQAAVATDPNGTIIYWNRFAETLFGWSREDAIHRHILELTPALDPVEKSGHVMSAMRMGKIWSGEFVIQRPDQTSFPVQVLDTPILDDEGKLKAIVRISTDITERKRAEQTFRFLAEASAALAALVDYESTLRKVARLAVPFFADWCTIDILDADGSLRRLAVTHVDPLKVELGYELHKRYPPDKNAPRGVWNILRTGVSELISVIPDSFLVEAARDDEMLRHLREPGIHSYIGVPLKVRGQAIGVITFLTAESKMSYDANDLAVAEDLAHRATVAVENARLYRAATEADRRKDEFLATLAHELRNPLAPIKNAVAILRSHGLKDPSLEWARNVIDRQVEQMTRLVDDLLDISRISRGKVDLHKQIVDLAEMVNRAVETTRPLLEERGHDLNISLPEVPVRLSADPTRLEQILANLLNNSAKYTEPGGKIWLTAQREGSGVVIKVRDTDIGITPAMLPLIFEMFVQADHPNDRAKGGLGIGLSLVRSLITTHGGTITARSDGVGKGSEFTVNLPLAAESPEAEPAAVPSPGDAQVSTSSHRILIVDDNVDAAESLALLLRLSGHETEVAKDGRAALEIIRANAPDMVFLDIGLPGMDGYEVARQIRRMPGREQIFLLALTGWGQTDDRRRSKEAGFDRHLVKPLDPAELPALMEGLASARE